MGDGEEFADVLVVQAVAGVDSEAQCVRLPRAFDEAVQFVAAGFPCSVGEGAGVELNVFGLQCGGGLDLVRIGVDEEADHCADVVEFGDRVGQGDAVSDAIESTFGGYFVAVFGNETSVVWFDLECDRHDFGGVAHFKIKLGLERFFQPEDVAVLDVAAVLAKVGGDAVGAGLFGDEGGGDRVGFDQDALRITRVTRLTQGGGVVDVDAEAERHGQTFPP